MKKRIILLLLCVLGCKCDSFRTDKAWLAVVSHGANPSNLLQTATAMTETMKQLKERVNYIVRMPKISLIAAICMVLICAIVAGCAAAGSTGAQQGPEKDPPATTTPTSTPETSPATNPTTKPTEPKPTDPAPTDPSNDELAKFNALFGDVYGWYNKALTSEYTTPAQLDLMLFFLGEFREESNQVTDSERAQLKDLYGYSDDIDMLDITCLPVDKMNQVLTELFGITLEDVEDAGFYDMNYLESTNCYYIVGNGASGAMDFNALAVKMLDDGTIRVSYTQFTGSEDEMFVVTLLPYGDGYRVLSNLSADHPAQCEYAQVGVLQEATCVQPEILLFACVHCGHQIQQENKKDIDHDYSKTTVTKKATCISEGEKSYVCSMCGKTKFYKTIPVSSEHDYKLVDKEKYSDTFAGTKWYRCKDCGLEKECYYGKKGNYDLDAIAAEMAEYVEQFGFHFQIITADDLYYSQKPDRYSFKHCEMMGGPDFLYDKVFSAVKSWCNERLASCEDTGVDPSAYVCELYLDGWNNGSLGGTFFSLFVSTGHSDS